MTPSDLAVYIDKFQKSKFVKFLKFGTSEKYPFHATVTYTIHKINKRGPFSQHFHAWCYFVKFPGYEVEGLFRRCGRVTTMKEVQEKYDDGKEAFCFWSFHFEGFKIHIVYQWSFVHL